MAEEGIRQEFRFKNIDKTRNYLVGEININWWLKRVNFIEHFSILGFTISGFISIFALASLIGIPIGITSSAIELKICAITAVIEKYK